MKRVGKTQLAKELNKSRQYIYDCVKSGKLVFDPDGKIDVEFARKKLEDNTDQSKIRTVSSDPSDIHSINISEIKTAEDFFNQTNGMAYQPLQNLKIQMEVFKNWRDIEIQNRTLLKADDVREILQQHANLLATSFENLPIDTCKELSTMKDELEIEEFLDKKIRNIIDEFINQITMSDANAYT